MDASADRSVQYLMITAQIDGPRGVTEWHVPLKKARLPTRACYGGTSPIRTPPPPWDATVALCLGTYGDPRGLGVSYQRGTLAESPSYMWGFKIYTSHVRHPAEFCALPISALQKKSSRHII